MTEKVYCDECKYFNHKVLEKINENTTKPCDIKECLCPENMGTWENRQELKGSPADLNSYNMCNWFEKKTSSLSKSLNQAWEDRRKHSEWADRFVVFGHILLDALEQVAQNYRNPDANMAAKALSKFKNKVKVNGL